jgi:uncharacterized membrane protein
MQAIRIARGAAMMGAFTRVLSLVCIAAGLTIAAASPARADLRVCNRTSYVIDAAVAIEDKGAATTRGWFRVDPGACAVAIEGAVTGEEFFIHARVPEVYGEPPAAQGQATYCVGAGNFTLTRPRNCGGGQSPASFTRVRPTETERGLAIYLAEEAEYTDAQAHDAGVQRLLVVAGYDANPIDGIRVAKTDNAIALFLKDNDLPPTWAGRTDFFSILLDAAQKPGVGFSWCNDTGATVMAAIGIEDADGILTRGWYRVEPGKCVRPEITGRPTRLYSFGEAVDADGQPLKRAGTPLAWGGAITLCTRNVKFELTDRADCAAKGLAATGFAPVERAGRTAIVRFK